MARAASRRKRRSNRRRGSAGLPGGLLMGSALLVCLGFLGWYFRSGLEAMLDRPPGEKPAASVKAPDRGANGRPAAPKKPVVAEAPDRFQFYRMLPDAEVEIADQPEAPGAAAPPPVSLPGTYVVQAGAFPGFAEADRVKARLALLGVVSEIQTAEADGAQFHRVRIGPMENLNELNRLLARLRQNNIEYLVIPVGE